MKRDTLGDKAILETTCAAAKKIKSVGISVIIFPFSQSVKWSVVCILVRLYSQNGSEKVQRVFS